MKYEEAVLSPSALKWMEDEVEYLNQRNPNAAIAFINRIEQACETMGQFPNLGAMGSIQNTRRFFFDSFVMTTKQNADGLVEVLAIRHSRQRDAYNPAIEDVISKTQGYDDSDDGSGGGISGGP